MKNILIQEEITRINDICNQYNIENYTINSDGTIDVNGHVDLYNINLTSLPLRFNVVIGDFNCSYNKLTSLEGCPKEVGGSFNCNDNFLTSLEFTSISVGNNFNCSNNNLTSLEFSPKEIGGYFYCSNNNLTSLEFSAKEIGGYFYCSFNKLTSLEGYPKEVVGSFYCDYNQLPVHFKELYNKLNDEEWKIFVKYQNDLRIWDDGYDQEAAQLLYDDIKDGLL